MDGRVLREIHSLRIVAGHDDFDLEAFCEKRSVRGDPRHLVSAVVGAIFASDAAACLSEASLARGEKNVLTLVWSMARNAEGSRLLKKPGDLNFTFLQGSGDSACCTDGYGYRSG